MNIRARDPAHQRFEEEIGAVCHRGAQVAGGNEKAEREQEEHRVARQSPALLEQGGQNRRHSDRDAQPKVKLQRLRRGLLLAECQPRRGGNDRGQGNQPGEPSADVIG